MNAYSQGSKAVDGNKLVDVVVIADYDTISPGMNFRLGIILTPEKKWHTYWINPGDAGLPTVIDLKLPKGVKSGDLLWEVPHKISFAGMANYGYEGRHILTIPIYVPTDFDSDILKISAEISWLVCREECVPGSKKVDFTLNVTKKDFLKNMENFLILDKSSENHSLVNQDFSFNAKKISENESNLEIILPEYLKNLKNLVFYPLEAGYFDNAHNQNFNLNNSKVLLNLKYDKFRENNPKKVIGILVGDEPLFKDKPNKSVFVEVDIN
jgi:thiol:disulfide interchange protein DsbD